ncbi:hypothetical protein B7H23_12890 [Notoacmeibacter marinus]|uniref:Uncharacterized protein n=1 Tax=Notoacmeibacter marinus TaxID=1876515 RepID=A0A231UUZ8_9HYPH|nr:hypothetical protein B7H23_12890 [Notoacmeibacter marinus]
MKTVKKTYHPTALQAVRVEEIMFNKEKQRKSFFQAIGLMRKVKRNSTMKSHSEPFSRTGFAACPEN